MRYTSITVPTTYHSFARPLRISIYGSRKACYEFSGDFFTGTAAINAHYVHVE